MPTVLKFGGSAIKSTGDLSSLVSCIAFNSKRVVVVSALFGATNKLIDLANLAETQSHRSKLEELYEFHNQFLLQKQHLPSFKKYNTLFHDYFEQLKRTLASHFENNSKSLDYVMSFGEKFSCVIFSLYLSEYRSLQLIDTEAVIKTNSNFGSAEVDYLESIKLIKKNITFQDTDTYVLGGFLGSDSNGQTTTVGRNGSDYTASIIALATNAKHLVLYKDVDGVYDSDPKSNKNAKRIPHLSFDEMKKLLLVNSKIIHPKTIDVALEANFDIIVRSCNCKNETLITAN